jgi:hypothetical protein
MVVQVTREGKRRRRFRKASPTGLKASTTCRWAFTSEMKNWYNCCRPPSIFAFFAFDLRPQPQQTAW